MSADHDIPLADEVHQRLNKPTLLAEAIGGELDADGVRHINRNIRGCRHCGSVTTIPYPEGEEPRMWFYHNSTECCPDALTKQIRDRDHEIKLVEAAIEREYADLRTLEEQAQDAPPREQKQLHRKAERMRAGLQHKDEHVWRDKLRDLNAERDRVAKKRAWMVRQQQEANR